MINFENGYCSPLLAHVKRQKEKKTKSKIQKIIAIDPDQNFPQKFRCRIQCDKSQKIVLRINLCFL